MSGPGASSIRVIGGTHPPDGKAFFHADGDGEFVRRGWSLRVFGRVSRLSTRAASTNHPNEETKGVDRSVGWWRSGTPRSEPGPLSTTHTTALALRGVTDENGSGFVHGEGRDHRVHPAKEDDETRPVRTIDRSIHRWSGEAGTDSDRDEAGR